jgi:His-Xaa-Ser system protein HxsD
MDGASSRNCEPVFQQLGEQAAAIEIDLSIYSLPAVLRACYKLTDRAYIYLSRVDRATDSVLVTIGTKNRNQPVDQVVGTLCNEFVDQQIRENLATEAGTVRALIVAQAFAEGNLIDVNDESADYEEDPLNIGEQR